MEWELLPQNDEFDGDIYYRLPDWVGSNGGGVMGEEDIPHYSAFHPYAVVVEEYIERRDLAQKYAEILALDVLKILYPEGDKWAYLTRLELFRVLHATPEQRCKAALKAVRNATG